MSTEIKTVPLETPLKRDAGALEALSFRRPVSGDYRGLSIARLGQLDYDEVRKLLPRISMDGLIVEEVDRIDGADQLEICAELTDFLSVKRRKADSPTM